MPIPSFAPNGSLHAASLLSSSISFLITALTFCVLSVHHYRSKHFSYTICLTHSHIYSTLLIAKRPNIFLFGAILHSILTPYYYSPIHFNPPFYPCPNQLNFIQHYRIILDGPFHIYLFISPLSVYLSFPLIYISIFLPPLEFFLNQYLYTSLYLPRLLMICSLN